MQELTTGRRTYSLYGLTIASDFAFENLQPTATAAQPDLEFTCRLEPPRPIDLQAAPVIHSPPFLLPDGTQAFKLYRLADGGEVLSFTGWADFYLWPQRVVCHLLKPDEPIAAELFFLGVVLAYWAEGHRIAALHASAVVTRQGTVAFLASGGSGKTSLAASFVQSGAALLTDDVLAIRDQDGTAMASPGFALMRMWPEQAQLFVGGIDGLRLVYYDDTKLHVPVGTGRLGSFCDTAQELAAIYLPERRDPAEQGGRIAIQPVPSGEALFLLVGHSYAARLISPIARQKQRLAMLMPLTYRVPVRRLIYPSGYDFLPQVRRAVLDDMAQLADSRFLTIEDSSDLLTPAGVEA